MATSTAATVVPVAPQAQSPQVTSEEKAYHLLSFSLKFWQYFLLTACCILLYRAAKQIKIILGSRRPVQSRQPPLPSAQRPDANGNWELAPPAYAPRAPALPPLQGPG
jgi:hypothetical protein